jgi:hypothetical protein
LPKEAEDLPTTLRIVPMNGYERWERQFGNMTLTTTQWAEPEECMKERFRCLELRYRIDRQMQCVHHKQLSAALRYGRLRIALPRSLAPQVTGSETATATPNRVRVQVDVRLPLIGLLLSYDGEVDMLETWP